MSLGVLVAGMIVLFAFHLLVSIPCLVSYRTRTWRYPHAHLRGMMPAMAISFGSASSAVTLPVNMECCENLGCVQPFYTTLHTPFTTLV